MCTHRKFFKQNGEARLQYFGVGQAAVGHMCLYDRRAVKAGPRARSTCDGFIILVSVVAEGEIVHRPLRTRHHTQRTKQGIGNHLACLDIARNDRSGIARVDQRSFRRNNRDRFQTAFVHGNAVVDQRADNIEDRCTNDRYRRVEIAVQLRSRSAKVDDGGSVFPVDPDRHLDHRLIVHGVAEMPVGKAQDQAAHGLFGMVLHMLHIGRHNSPTIVAADPHQFRCALGTGRNLRFQIGYILRDISRWP